MGDSKGEVVCVKEGYIIARAKINGTRYRAYTPSGKYVGRVIRIFGPVSRPYIKIKIERKWGRNVKELKLRRDRNGRKRQKKVDR